MNVKLLLLLWRCSFRSPIFAAAVRESRGQLSLGSHHVRFSMAIAPPVVVWPGKATAAPEAWDANPGASAPFASALLLGLVLMNRLALYTLVIIFAKVV